jgi:C4-dicarboxylate-specific signal transduction histidine kinase
VIKKNGDIAFIEAHGSRIEYKGKPTIIGTALDISDRKRAEEEAHRRVKLEGILEMAAAICHEMNQPMQTISGYSDLLLMNISKTDKIYGKLDVISKQIDRMCTITSKLMAINNVEIQDYVGISRIVDINTSSRNDKE